MNQEAGKFCKITAPVGPKSSQSSWGGNGIILHPAILMLLSLKRLVVYGKVQVSEFLHVMLITQVGWI